MCETLIGRNLVPITTWCVCVFLDVIHWFRVIVNYSMCKGDMVVNREGNYWFDKIRWD